MNKPCMNYICIVVLCLNYIVYITTHHFGFHQLPMRLPISCPALSKWVRPLITLSFNQPKPTKGLDALSISPFFMIDDNLIKAYKKNKNLTF
jgi:hypothetical protein